MSPRAFPSSGDLPRPTARAVVTSPFRLQTYRNLLYLLLSFPLGVGYFVFLVTGLAVGGSLAVLLVGIPILLFVLACCHLGGSLERLAAERLLRVEIPSPGYPFLEPDALSDRVRTLVRCGETWKSMGYLASKFAVGTASFVLLTTSLSISLSLLLTPLYYDEPGVFVGLRLPEPLLLTPSIRVPWEELLIGVELALRITSWEVTTPLDAVAMSALGFGCLVVSLAVLNGFAWVLGRFTRLLLGASDRSLAATARSWLGSR